MKDSQLRDQIDGLGDADVIVGKSAAGVLKGGRDVFFF
jgi:hypothetical protein